MTTAGPTVVVVGASLGGLRTAEELRRAGFTGQVTLLGEEVHLPYDRPPLSKQVLSGTWTAERAFFRTAAELDDLEITVRTGVRATGLHLHAAPDEHAGKAMIVPDEDGSAGRVTLHTGEQVSFDRLVIATGARPRQLPGQQMAGVLTLRTLDDVAALSAAFARRPRVVVIGGGFIGAEVAAAARRMDLPVTLVEQSSAPLSRVLGEQVGTACAQLHRDHGVTVLTDTVVAGLTGDTQVTGVELADGQIVPADLVVVGIGAIPNDEWLRDSALTVDNGVVCDATGSAAPHVWAVGDVARWRHDVFDASIRVEHWTHATEQAHVVAHNICNPCTPRALTGIPYVWSDQHQVKIQIAGRPHGGATMVPVTGTPGQRGFVALYAEADTVIGAVSFDNPRMIARIRRLIGHRPTTHDALAALAG